MVRVGYIVLIMPDLEGQQVDKSNGYDLGINLAEVIGLCGDTVEVSFLFGKTWTGPWQRWVTKPEGQSSISLIVF